MSLTHWLCGLRLASYSPVAGTVTTVVMAQKGPASAMNFMMAALSFLHGRKVLRKCLTSYKPRHTYEDTRSNSALRAVNTSSGSSPWVVLALSPTCTVEFLGSFQRIRILAPPQSGVKLRESCFKNSAIAITIGFQCSQLAPGLALGHLQ